MKRPLAPSLRMRLLALVALALLPAFALIIFNAIENHRRAGVEVNRTALRLARQAAQSHEQMIDEAYGLLSLLTRARHILLDVRSCSGLLNDFSTRYPNFSSILVLNSKGTVTCSSQSGYDGVNYADRDWFKDAAKGRRFVTSSFLIGRVITKPTVVFAAPIIDLTGKTQGVVSVAARLDWVNRLNEHELLPAGSTFTVFDWNGTILARQPEPERWIGQSFRSSQLFRTILREQKEGTAELHGADGTERLYAYKPLGQYKSPQSWFVAVGIPKETAYSDARKALTQSLAITGTMAALVLAIAWFGSWTLVLKPIHALIDASRRLGRGDLSARTGMAPREDEIGQLAATIDQMAASIEAREADRRKVREIHEQLAAIIESSGDAIISRSLDGIVTSWNQGAENLFGYSAEEMIGRSIMELVPGDDIERVKKNFENIKRGTPIDSYEAVRVRKDGTTFAVSVTVSPIIAEAGAIIGASSITRDISQRKRSENELRLLHEINLAISSTLDRQAVLQNLLEKIEVLLPYAASHIRLLNDTSGRLEPVACRNLDEQQWKSGDTKSDFVILKKVLNSRQPVVIADLQGVERFRRREFYRQQGLVSYLGMPLIVKDQAIGVLSLLTRHEHQFTDDEIRFAERLAKQASIAIYNAQLYEESKDLSVELQRREKQIRDLANGLIHAHDEAAKRIAHVLHDESGQLLAMVYISLDELGKNLTDAEKQRVEKVKNLLDGVENRLRDLSHELHPAMLDHLGLLPSLDSMAKQIGKRTGIDFMIDEQLSERLSPLLELTIYRVVQEAFNNAARHSRARTVSVRLLQDQELIQCAIQDDGVGFCPAGRSSAGKPKPRGLGLAGMRERVEAIGGTLQILSAPGEGTKVFLSIPKEKIGDSPDFAC